MESFLAQPVIQSGLAPFAVSLLVAVALRRAGLAWQGLAIVAGIFVAILLIVGPTLLPLTSTRKIVIVSLGLPLLAVGLGGLRPPLRYGLPAVGAASALLWVLWPVLARMGWAEALPLALALGLYVLWMVATFTLLARRPARFGGAALVCAAGTGAAALLAASALYAQLAFALAAATAGLLLVWLLRPESRLSDAGFGLATAMAVATLLALLGAAATVYATLPLPALPFLAASPALALLPVARHRPAWLRGAAAAGLALLPVVVAVYLAWQAAGDVIY